MYLAEELVAAGGPSAPVWAFLTAISLGILAMIGQQITAKRTARETKDEAVKAHAASVKASENTLPVSNGFVSRVDRKLDSIITEQNKQGNALREHLEWHLNNPSRKG